MSKARIFNNREVTEMMVRYSRHPRSVRLRDQIMDRVYPLIDAAISKKRLFHLRDDLKQECAMKVFQSLPKFSHKRGSAFAFLWTAICNVCITQGKKLSRRSLSIEEDEILREAEAASPSKYLSPEHAHLVTVLSGILNEALLSNGLRVFFVDKDKKAIAYLTVCIANGDFFSDKLKVIKQLRRYGLKKKDSLFLCDYVLVTLRTKLYDKKEILNGLASQEAGSHLPEKSPS